MTGWRFGSSNSGEPHRFDASSRVTARLTIRPLLIRYSTIRHDSEPCPELVEGSDQRGSIDERELTPRGGDGAGDHDLAAPRPRHQEDIGGMRSIAEEDLGDVTERDEPGRPIAVRTVNKAPQPR